MALMTFSPKVNANWKGGEKKRENCEKNEWGRKEEPNEEKEREREKQEIKKVEDVVEKV